MAGNGLYVPELAWFASLIAQKSVGVRLTGGFCVVASTVACLDIRSVFVALRRCLGADGAVARQPHSSGGGTRIAGSRSW